MGSAHPSMVGNEYRLGKKIGEGCNVNVYRGVCKSTGEGVAIKLLPKDSPQMEPTFYNLMGAAEGIPGMRWSGVAGNYIAIVMELLGPSLAELFRRYTGRFSLKTVLLLGDQLITRLEHIHNANIVHGDIKPENILMGRGENKDVVHIVDFGLAKLYQVNGQHLPMTLDNEPVNGIFASINAHHGRDLSRRDDLESLGYVLVYLFRGSLPWEGLQAAKNILQQKLSVKSERLCDGYPELDTFLNYSKRLNFDEKPNYEFLRTLFRNLLRQKCCCHNLVFDWDIFYVPYPNNYEEDQGVNQGVDQEGEQEDNRYLVEIPAMPESRISSADRFPQQEREQTPSTSAGVPMRVGNQTIPIVSVGQPLFGNQNNPLSVPAVLGGHIDPISNGASQQRQASQRITGTVPTMPGSSVSTVGVFDQPQKNQTQNNPGQLPAGSGGSSHERQKTPTQIFPGSVPTQTGNHIEGISSVGSSLKPQTEQSIPNGVAAVNGGNAGPTLSTGVSQEFQQTPSAQQPSALVRNVKMHNAALSRSIGNGVVTRSKGKVDSIPVCTTSKRSLSPHPSSTQQQSKKNPVSSVGDEKGSVGTATSSMGQSTSRSAPTEDNRRLSEKIKDLAEETFGPEYYRCLMANVRQSLDNNSRAPTVTEEGDVSTPKANVKEKK